MPRTTVTKTQNPAVIVDVLFEEHQIFVLVQNNSDQPVYRVSVKFDKAILGWDGTKDISALKLFKKIEFLAPRKTIRVFVDRSQSYFSRRQPTLITAKIAYFDAKGKAFTSAVKHDLSIYKDITSPRQPEPR